jgi:hypothetical protein
VRPQTHAWSYVVVVRPGEPALASYLRRRLGADPTVDVVVDRRRGERRRGDGPAAAIDRRRGERRRPRPEAGSIFDMPVIVRRSAARRAHERRNAEESATMELDRSDVSQESMDRWVTEGQTLFARLVDENGTLRRRAEAAEREGEKIRHEAGLLAREIEQLRREIEQMRAQQAEVVETFMRLLTHTDQMLRPVNDLLERLKGGARRVS